MIKLIKKIIWFISHNTPYFKGKMRLIEFFTRPKKNKDVIVTRQNVNWSIYGQDLIEFNIAYKSHDKHIRRSLINEIKVNDINILWDIGANIGSITLPIIKQFPNIQSMMFEPSPKVMGKLIQNLTINPDLEKRCRLYCLALSNQTSLSKFYSSNESYNSGVGGLGISHNREKFGIFLNTDTGDRLIKDNVVDIPEIIKIDVEGYEIEVLQGLKETLKTYKPIILFEHCIYRLNERNKPKEQVFNFLNSFGYKFYNSINNQQIFKNDLNNDLDIIAKSN